MCFQFGSDVQLADISPNDAMVQKYFEDSKGWIEQGDVRQPKVDVPFELSKLNFSECVDLCIKMNFIWIYSIQLIIEYHCSPFVGRCMANEIAKIGQCECGEL